MPLLDDQPDIPPTNISSYVFWSIPFFGQPPIWRTNLAQRMRFVVAGEVIHLPGDYNVDGEVDSQDYDAWSAEFGAAGPNDADGSGNEIVDAADYTICARPSGRESLQRGGSARRSRASDWGNPDFGGGALRRRLPSDAIRCKIEAMNEFDPQAYGPVFAPLLEVDRRRPLDAGTPNKIERATLGQLTAETAFAHAARALADHDMAECCLAGLWLLHDFLDESHQVSQGIDTTSGSFWHGIMHRREGDFSNAKYWFRHVGEHPVFEPLAQRAAELAAEHGAAAAVDRLTSRETWEPFAFVDLCQAAERKGGKLRELCLDVQQAEWELLFDYCFRAAIGAYHHL